MNSIMMDRGRDESCPCSCHKNPEGVSAMHIVACCSPCRFCKRNIPTAFYDSHVEDCGKKSLEYFKDVIRKC